MVFGPSECRSAGWGKDSTGGVMSSSTSAYTGDSPPIVADERPDPSEQFIDRQLRKTRMQIKLVDLAVSTAQCAAGLLGAMLVLILVDHWVFGLGFWTRLLALVALIAAAVWFLGGSVLPLLVRPISALYAARTIEASAPTLKNSLINFLFFRGERAALSRGVYDALQDRAALDLRSVPLDSAVDRTRLIRVGYVLAAVLTMCAAYTILSPKDPFQTIHRVSAPWADISRPARVAIEDVQPGDADVYQGQHIPISALVRGIGADEQVTLIYTTADSQAVEQPLAMKWDSSGRRQEVDFPPDAAGIRQVTDYRIRAGDALSRTYRLKVSPAPSFRIERVEYRYPAYMKRPASTAEGKGPIKAPEGTRVTVHAEANYPIRSAAIEFDSGGSAKGKGGGTPDRLPMEFASASAHGSWVLELMPDRASPRHVSYQIRFTNTRGQQSENAVQFPIEVSPDLPPEVEILSPERDRIDVPQNGAEKIEIRAVDPDFGLTRIGVRGAAKGADVLKADLLNDAAGRAGQTVVQYALQPAKIGLSVGDEVVVWAVAEDNRTSPGSETPSPNIARTRNYHFRIVAPAKPDDAKNSPDGDKKQDGKNEDRSKPGEKSQSGSGGQQQGPGQTGSSNEKGGQEKSDSSSGGGSSSEGAAGSESQPMQQGPEQSGSGQSGAEQSGSEPSGNSNSKDSSGGSQGGSGETGNSAATAGGASEAGGKEESGKESGSNDNGGSQNSANQDGGNSGSASAKGEGGQTGGGAGSPREEPLHDGEVIEKTLEHMQSSGKAGQGANDANPGQSANPRNGNTGSGQSQAAGQPGEKPPGERQPNDKQQGENAGASPAKPQTQDKAGSSSKSEPPAAKPEAGKGEAGTEGAKPNEGTQGAKPEGQTPAAAGEAPDQAGSKPSAQAEGASPQQTPGKSGAGQPGEKPQSGMPEGANRDREKTQEGNGNEKQGNEASPNSQSKHQSDSAGSSTGDRSGGGEQGAGQNARQPNGNSPGSTSAGDQGAGAAGEPGQGETGASAGDKSAAAKPTGQPGQDKGAGSAIAANKGNDPSSKPSTSSKPDAAGEKQPPGAAQPAGAGSKMAGGEGAVTGGGVPGSNSTAGNTKAGEVADNEEANLDYARKVTDLVLEYLSNQESRPDEKLLGELGWSQDDLKNFLQRWRELKQAAGETPDGKRELDESLKSLGLRPAADQVRKGASRDDQLPGLRDSGLRSSPPPQYLEQFDAFKKGTSRVGQ
jgi:hypothetical protein